MQHVKIMNENIFIYVSLALSLLLAYNRCLVNVCWISMNWAKFPSLLYGGLPCIVLPGQETVSTYVSNSSFTFSVVLFLHHIDID